MELARISQHILGLPYDESVTENATSKNAIPNVVIEPKNDKFPWAVNICEQVNDF